MGFMDLTTAVLDCVGGAQWPQGDHRCGRLGVRGPSGPHLLNRNPGQGGCSLLPTCLGRSHPSSEEPHHRMAVLGGEDQPGAVAEGSQSG